ncbi:hypothetical protein [Streptomyces sp. NPDC049879]|uniref:hypothetical protein n=1 Tax=Streptomyces sp. NPDC049879 TaxID=3365598 RepID=UPI00378820BD
MRYTKPNFNYYKTNRDKAQAYAAQASWANIGRAERQAYIELAHLYLELSIQDDNGNTAPTEDAAKAKEAERETERSARLAGHRGAQAGTAEPTGTGVKNWFGPTKTD